MFANLGLEIVFEKYREYIRLLVSVECDCAASLFLFTRYFEIAN